MTEGKVYSKPLSTYSKKEALIHVSTLCRTDYYRIQIMSDEDEADTSSSEEEEEEDDNDYEEEQEEEEEEERGEYLGNVIPVL
jgi:hypothetical protein